MAISLFSALLRNKWSSNISPMNHVSNVVYTQVFDLYFIGKNSLKDLSTTAAHLMFSPLFRWSVSTRLPLSV
jgi:hypothetical protein